MYRRSAKTTCLPIIHDSPKSHQFANGIWRSGVERRGLTLNRFLPIRMPINRQFKSKMINVIRDCDAHQKIMTIFAKWVAGNTHLYLSIEFAGTRLIEANRGFKTRLPKNEQATCWCRDREQSPDESLQGSLTLQRHHTVQCICEHMLDLNRNEEGSNAYMGMSNEVRTWLWAAKLYISSGFTLIKTETKLLISRTSP